MTVPHLAAVALADHVERLGSYFGFAAVIGLGVLSMLYFAQAREVKRLREWAGRSPERDAELAQRVQSDAQRRVVAAPVQVPRPVSQPVSPQTAAAQQADAARKAAAAAAVGNLQQPGSGPAPVVGPPGQLDRPAAAAGTSGAPAAAGTSAAPGASPAAGSTPGAASTPGATPAPGSVAGAAAAAAAAGAGGAAGAAGKSAVPGASASGPATSPPATPAPTAATAGAAAAAAARQAGPPGRTPPFANGSGGQDTHESPAARPAPLPDLPLRAPRAVTPASSRLSDDDGRSRGAPPLGAIVGGVVGVLAVAIVLVLVLSGGGDNPPADNQIGGSPPPPAAASPSSSSATKVNRKATQVAVLNGTTQTGLARNVGNKLESSGFTILSVGDNADQQIATTTISYAGGAEKAARVVAQIMDVPSSAVQPIDTNTAAAVQPDAKVVVVVGSDRSSTG